MKRFRFCLGFASLILVSAPAKASEALADGAPLFEISPDAGFMGGSTMLGLRAAMNYHPVTLEMGSEQVIGNTATLYPITLSAVLDLSRMARVVPYGTVGGGLFLTVPIGSVGDEAVSSVGLTFGGGLRYYISPKIGIRFETRQLFTKLYNHLDNRDEILIFQSSSLGVIIAFG